MKKEFGRRVHRFETADKQQYCLRKTTFLKHAGKNDIYLQEAK